MGTEDLRLTVDVAALQRLPQTSRLVTDARPVGPVANTCEWMQTCCCTHFTDAVG